MLDSDRQRMATRLASFGAPAVPVLAAAADEFNQPRQREVAELALREVGTPALEWARAQDDQPRFRLLVRLALDTELAFEARPLLVDRLPRHRGWLLEQLRAGPSDAARNEGIAVVRLLGHDAMQVGESLCPLLDAQGRREWELAMNVAETVGRSGARACAPALGRALTIPSWRVTSIVLEALARLGSGDGDVKGSVLRVATGHWSQRIRWRAVTTLRFLSEPTTFDEPAAIRRTVTSGSTLAAYLAAGAAADDPVAAAFGTLGDETAAEADAAPECAVGRTWTRPVRVRDLKEMVTLFPLASGTEKRLVQHAARLPRATLAGLGLGLDVPLEEAARDAVPMDSVLVVAACAGARGGGLLEIPRHGPPRILRRGCFERMMTVGPDRQTLWVFEGPSHLGATQGRIWRLDREATTVLLPVVDLPAGAIATGRGPTAVLVATPLGDVAVDLDGTLRPLDCGPR